MTETQLRCLEFVRDRIRATGVAPTYPEMGRHLGSNSRSGVYAIVQRLVRDGHLIKAGAGSRSLQLPGVNLAVVPTDDLQAELERRI